MKTLIGSFWTLGLMTSITLTEDSALIEAKLIPTTITPGLLEGLPYKNCPNIPTEGAELVFFFQAEAIVSYDKESFPLEGWNKHFQSNIASSGKSAAIISNDSDIHEELKVDARIDVIVRTDSVTKNLILMKDAKPKKCPFSTLELDLEDKKGVSVIGQYEMIRKNCIIYDAKEIINNG